MEVTHRKLRKSRLGLGIAAMAFPMLAWSQVGAAPAALPEVMGIPVDFILFALTLLGVGVTTLVVMIVGAAASFDVLFRKPLQTLRSQ